MNISEILEKHGIDNSDLARELKSYSTSAVEKASEGMISKDVFKKRIKDQGEMNAKLSEYEAKIESLESKVNEKDEKLNEISVLQEENQNLKNEVKSTYSERWQKIKSKMLTKDGKLTPKAEKIADDFKFGSEEEELELEDIKTNLDKFKPYEKVGYFEDSKNFSDTKNKTPEGSVDNQSDWFDAMEAK